MIIYKELYMSNLIKKDAYGERTNLLTVYYTGRQCKFCRNGQKLLISNKKQTKKILHLTNNL